ncbi:U3 small nucleolar ribonucleoprotein IMP4 [Trichoplax sp. H2]|nr:U3 small nucleolar ribonucleoprotein IMP4 [Trichoplax sp. H2]|eukprot:RDD43801.1 U3 small nucleolar ribonucleoprotein IMP4 [Trichoplax sp. H2]
MLRRQVRERKEYIYRKAKEEQERTIHEKKKKLKAAIDSGKPIPTELRKEEAELRKELEFDDRNTDKYIEDRDDEYKWAGVNDPSIMITTSHEPSSKLKQFAKEMKLIFPNCQRMNRGNHVLSELIQACRANNVTDLIIVHEHRGQPDGMIVSHLPYGPTAYFTLSNVVMRHDIENIGPMSEAYPHLIFHKFSSKLGLRVKNILRYLFPVPKESTRRIITFANDDDFISFRHHVYKRAEGNIELMEVGPRFEMKLFAIRLGTIDEENTADVEWKIRPYLNTAKKRKWLESSDS